MNSPIETYDNDPKQLRWGIGIGVGLAVMMRDPLGKLLLALSGDREVLKLRRMIRKEGADDGMVDLVAFVQRVRFVSKKRAVKRVEELCFHPSYVFVAPRGNRPAQADGLPANHEEVLRPNMTRLGHLF